MTPPQETTPKDYQQLWKDVTNCHHEVKVGTDEVKAVPALGKILTDKEGRDFILCLGEQDAELCMKLSDRGTTGHALTPTEKHAFFVTLRRLAERHGKLPDRMMITEEIDVLDEIHAFGGFGEVRNGTYKGDRVAVKTARVPLVGDLTKIRKRFYREVVLWSTLSHPNILKFVGVKEDAKKRQFSTVSEWMGGGNIMEFIEEHSINRLELLHGAAKGVQYLHSINLTHGDLKGSNILVTIDTPHRACLADFDFITAVLDPDQKLSCSAQVVGGTMQFMPPELLVPETESAKSTPQADIYAFGLVIFQVLTGGVPFPGMRDSAVGYHVRNGMRPHRPTDALAIGFSDSLWKFTDRCWNQVIGLRPGVGEVVTRLNEAAVAWGRPMPPCSQSVGDASLDSEDLSSDSDQPNPFQLSASDTPQSSAKSQTSFELLSGQNTPSTPSTDPPHK